MDELRQTWRELLVNIRPKVSEVNYNNWIKQISYLDGKDQTIKLGVPNIFVKEWVNDFYYEMIIQELFFLTKKNFALDFEVVGGGEEVAPVPNAPLHAQTQEQRTEPKPQIIPAVKEELPTTIKKPKTPLAQKLNPRYSFDKFVVGTSNQFAHAGAAASAELPGGHYNPLFIYGGVGLGKTHLINAVGLKISELFPDQRILYLSAEQFMNELIFCIRFEKMDQFRKKFREGCDVLLVDDVQFIVGKERTMEEFFHTFNTLYEAQKQIVVTSDRLPNELDGLEERLKSRFGWGLIADIQPPDLETRIAILKKKADLNKVTLTDDCALFLASQIRSNVRELEGSLIRLSAFASLNKIPITVELAKQVLKNIIRERAATCSVEAIQRSVADFYHIKTQEMRSNRRMKNIAMPRQIAMYLCKKHLGSSYPEIGQKFGGKDHSTVIHAVKKVEACLIKDEALRHDIETIEKILVH